MSTESEFHAEVEAAPDKLSTLVSQRGMRVLAEFAGGALVIGSEQGEVAEGQRELQSLFQQVFAQPARISWEWHSIRASRSGEVCWFFAEGSSFMAPSLPRHEAHVTSGA